MEYKRLLFGISILAVVITGCSQSRDKEYDMPADTNSNNTIVIDQVNSDSVAEAENGTDLIADNAQGISDIPASFRKDINGIRFDIRKVEHPDNLGSIKRCRIERIRLSDEQIINCFEQGHIITDTQENRSDDEEGKECLSYMAHYEGGDYLYTFMGNLTWTTPQYDKISYSYYDSNAEAYKKEKLAFSTPQASLDVLTNKLEKVGFEIGTFEQFVLALDQDTLQAQEVHEEKVGDRINIQSEWSIKDECYYYYLRQTYDGIPVYTGDSFFPDDTDVTSWPVAGAVSSDGVIYLSVHNLYSFKEEAVTWKTADFDTCAQVVADKYGNILSDAEYSVSRAQLYYVPVKREGTGYELHLAWLFEIEEAYLDPEFGNMIKNIYTLVDAETSEEIQL